MIIIPTYNERKNVSVLVARIRAVLPQIPILFVEDNSPDGTAEEIKQLQQSDPNIHILSRASKAGFASAYLDGFKYVLKNFNPSFVITMDADLSHPPEKLPELIAVAKEGKVAIGSRYTKGGAVKNWKLKRKILSRLGNLYARIFTRLPIKDLTGGFIAIPIEKMLQLDPGAIKSRGYAFLMELKAHLFRLGAEFVEVPITFEERKEGESKLAGSIVMEGLQYPLKLFWYKQTRINYPAWLVFFISFVVYLYTLPHSIFFGDSPEFMASAATLGIPHPPGYPAYAIVAKLFTYLPFGNLEFRIGLFSALCGSLSLVLFYFLFRKISDNRIIAVATALMLGFSNLFWSQAIMAKVYMPLTLIILALLLLFIKFWETKKSGYLIFALFLYGFGSGMHQIIFILFPLLFFVIGAYLYSLPKVFKYDFENKSFIYGILAFIVGLGVYAYLPIRYHMSGDFYNFPVLFDASRPGNWSGFIHYFLRTDYGDFGGKFSVGDKLIFLGSAFEWLWQQFYWLLLLVLPGIFYFRRHKKIGILTFGLFILNIFGIIILRSSAWGFENDNLYSYYYLPAYVIVALYIGAGIVEVIELIKSRLNYKLAPIIYIAVSAVAVFFLISNFKVNNLHNFDFVDRYTKTILESLPPNAVLLVQYPGANTDTVSFGFDYQQSVRHLRPDVTVLTVFRMYPNVDRKVLSLIYGLNEPKSSRYQLTRYAIKYFSDRPIYTTYLVDDLPPKVSWTESSNGLVYRLNPDPSLKQESLPHIQLDYQKDLTILEHDPLFGHDLLAAYFYSQAAYRMENNNLKGAQDDFITAIGYDYKVMGIDQKAYMFYRNRILGKL